MILSTKVKYRYARNFYGLRRNFEELSLKRNFKCRNFRSWDKKLDEGYRSLLMILSC